MDIVTLRLLLICAILSLCGIWIFFRGRKKNKHPIRGHLHHDMEDWVTPSDEILEPRGNNTNGQKGSDGDATAEDTAKTGQTGDSADSDNPPAQEDVNQNVICIHLRSRKREGFNGRNLQAIFSRFNLEFGKMDIYHRDIMAGGKSHVSFSVLNGKEPGTLRDIDLEAGTSILIFFIQIHQCYNPLRSFDEMLEVAKQFSISLDGLLYDELGSALTDQSLEYYRDQIKELLLTQRKEKNKK